MSKSVLSPRGFQHEWELSLMFNWLRKWKPVISQGSRRKQPVRRRSVLSVEFLENRTLLNAGGLDFGFGTDGYVPAAADHPFFDSVVQADGKIVVLGHSVPDPDTQRFEI